MTPQQLSPDAQSSGTLQASGESHARATHDVLGVFSMFGNSIQQCSPWAQSPSLSHRNTRVHPMALAAQLAVVLCCMPSLMQQISPADLSHDVSPQRIIPSPVKPPGLPPESTGGAPPAPEPESVALPPLPASATGSPPPPAPAFPPVAREPPAAVAPPLEAVTAPLPAPP
jgi:hypothetical protein